MKAKTRKKLARVLFVGTAVVAVAGVVALGWQWYRTIPLRAVEVAGNTYAPADTLVRLAGAEVGTPLYSVDPAIVADRVRRHPWVASAEVARLPTGTLRLRVAERVPVALAVDRAGRPAFLLDRDGGMMPRPQGAAFNVPLVHGLRAEYHPVRPVEDAEARALLRALGGLTPDRLALVSDVEFRGGEVWLKTTPLPERGAVPVRLGRGDYDRKLGDLHAFWHRAMLTQTGTAFELIDLRFNSQIVTREAALSP